MGFLSRVKRAFNDAKDLLPGPLDKAVDYATLGPVLGQAKDALSAGVDAAIPDVPSLADVQSRVDQITSEAETAAAAQDAVSAASDANRKRRFALLAGRAFPRGSLAAGNYGGLNV